jgi:hypothetical protein
VTGYFGDQVRGLDYSHTYRGVVVEVADPLLEGRVGVFIPLLLTETPDSAKAPAPAQVVVPPTVFENQADLNPAPSLAVNNYIWARPGGFLVEAGGGGRYHVPPVGSVVIVEFEHADPNRPYWRAATPTIDGDVVQGPLVGRATNAQRSSANWTDPAKRPNMEVLRQYPNGNTVYVDNNPDSNAFVIEWANGHRLVIGHADESGIYLQTQKGHLVQLDENSGEIRLRTQTGKSSLVLADSGDVTVTNSGNTHVATQGNVVVEAQGNADVKAAGNATITSALNTLNGPTTVNGALTVNGPVRAVGGAGGAGTGTFAGPVSVTGDVVVQGGLHTTGPITGSSVNGH